MENSAMDSKLERLLGEKGSMRLEKFMQDDGEKFGNFSRVQTAADDIDRRSEHFNTLAGNLEVTYDDGVFALVDKSSDRTMPFSEFGLSKLCETIHIPTDYIKRCLMANREELAVKNMNEWIKESMLPSKEVLIRTTDDRFYAMLTNKYAILDDHEVLARTYDILSNSGDYKVTNALVRPEYMKTRVVSRDRINLNGENLQFGFDIKNSRLGNGSLTIMVLLYRMICANGCLFGGGQGVFYRKRHVGITSEDFVAQFDTTIDEAPKVIENVKYSIGEARSEKVNSVKMQNMIDRFRAESFATKNMTGQLEQMWKEKYSYDQWGFVNATTELAQQYDYTNREQMELFAGRTLYRK